LKLDSCSAGNLEYLLSRGCRSRVSALRSRGPQWWAFLLVRRV